MSMEETAVLLSIRPEWCQKIFRGEKTMEIRKNFPKDFQGQPFKCFIYCTKGQNAGFRMEPDGSLLRLDGTVIGEFTCDRVYEIASFNRAPDDLEAQACMDRDQIWKYTRGKGYAWHITELKTYETPLDLAAFHLRCENALRWCNNGGCGRARNGGRRAFHRGSKDGGYGRLEPLCGSTGGPWEDGGRSHGNGGPEFQRHCKEVEK